MDKEPVQMDKKEWNKWMKAIKEWKIGSIMEKRVTKCEKGAGKQWERRRKKKKKRKYSKQCKHPSALMISDWKRQM